MRRRRVVGWKIVLGVAALAATCAVVLPTLVPRQGQHRSRAELLAFVQEHRAALEELVVLARQEKENVWVREAGAGPAADRYAPFLKRLGAPGPLIVIVEPFQVTIHLYIVGRDTDTLTYAPQLSGPFVEDLDEARAQGGGLGSAAMSVGGGWIVERSWD